MNWHGLPESCSCFLRSRRKDKYVVDSVRELKALRSSRRYPARAIRRSLWRSTTPSAHAPVCAACASIPNTQHPTPNTYGATYPPRCPVRPPPLLQLR